MPPILTATNEERLNADLAGLRRQRENVGIAQPFGIDRLAALNEGEGAQPVAQHCGDLEIHGLGGGGHRGAELFLGVLGLARQKGAGILDQFGIGIGADAVDTGRRTALDLVEQARPGAVGKKTVGARTQQKHLLQGVQGLVDRAGAGERAVIARLADARAAMLADARKAMVLAQHDEGETFVVAQQNIVGRAVALDELCFEQQRLGFGIGRYDGHVAGLRHHALQPPRQPVDLDIIADAILQRSRLADIQHIAAGIGHPVDTRAQRQGGEHVADGGDAAIEIGHILALHREGGGFF